MRSLLFCFLLLFTSAGALAENSAPNTKTPQEIDTAADVSSALSTTLYTIQLVGRNGVVQILKAAGIELNWKSAAVAAIYDAMLFGGAYWLAGTALNHPYLTAIGTGFYSQSALAILGISSAYWASSLFRKIPVLGNSIRPLPYLVKTASGSVAVYRFYIPIKDANTIADGVGLICTAVCSEKSLCTASIEGGKDLWTGFSNFNVSSVSEYKNTLTRRAQTAFELCRVCATNLTGCVQNTTQQFNEFCKTLTFDNVSLAGNQSDL